MARDGAQAQQRQTIPVFSEPLGSGGFTTAPHPGSTHYELQAFDAEGFRAPPGMVPVMIVRGLVVCYRAEESAGLAGAVPLPSAGRG